MKKNTWFRKIVVFLNLVLVVLLCLACFFQYVTVERIGFTSILGLVVPFLVFGNLFFVVFWLLFNRRFIKYSAIAVVLSFLTLKPFIRFNATGESKEGDLTVLSYNVLGFNKYGEIDNDHVFEDVKSFVETEKPDIICFQESGYLRQKEYDEQYPYRYLKYIHMEGKEILGIFSKYPIIKSELLDFPNSHNNAAFADIVVGQDTIRMYNIHLESLGVTNTSRLKRERSDRLFRRLNRAFGQQIKQAKLIRQHMDASPYKVLLCGDFNNTQFSNVYKIIKGEMSDSFMEKGRGYGRTYIYLRFPIRIDFIMADPSFEVVRHQNFDIKLSDHYPVLASFRLSSDE